MKSTELKFLLKLVGQTDYRASITKLNPNDKTPASERDKICRELGDRGIVGYSREIRQFTIEPAGKAILKQDTTALPLTEQQLIVLKACESKSATPGDLSKIPSTERQSLIQDLETKGLIKATKIQLKEVWLTEQGDDYLRNEYVPLGKGNITLSASQLQNLLHFIRKPIQQVKQSEESGASVTTSTDTESIAEKPTDSKVLEVIRELDQQFNTDNYLPIFYLRQKLQPPFLRGELDQVLYRLQRQDKIELSTLQEGKRYTGEQIEAGIPQPVGGHLFFIVLI